MIGAGVAQVTMLAACSAVVVCVAEAARYCLFAAQLAFIVHVPVLFVIVTVVPRIEQAPVALMVGTTGEFDVAATVKVESYGAVAGAPVKVTVGDVPVDAVVISVTVGAAR